MYPNEKDFHHTIAIGITQFPFVAVIDGVLIPESPLMAFKNNHFKKTSILIGTNLNEGSYFLPYSILANNDLLYGVQTCIGTLAGQLKQIVQQNGLLGTQN
jgi:carboxylesterase type B